jgi:hypothetical protein
VEKYTIIPIDLRVLIEDLEVLVLIEEKVHI